MTKILVIEDDPAMTVALRDGFEFEGYEVTVATDGATGLDLAESRDADLIILDVMLPKISGIDICQQLRAKGCPTPIIMLTARGQEIDKIVGLRTGADDYVTKPFSFMELLARVEAVLRRTRRSGEGDDELVFGDVRLDFRCYAATRAGEPLELSQREFRILKFFADRPGEVVSREMLLNGVWGYDGRAFSRTVDTHVSRLRQKIEPDPARPRHLITVHRMGYRFMV